MGCCPLMEGREKVGFFFFFTQFFLHPSAEGGGNCVRWLRNPMR